MGAAAIEMGFEFVGGSILAMQPNAVVFDDLNPGQNPFTGSITNGISIHKNGGVANAAFASLGGVVTAVADTLVLTLTTSGPGSLSLGGQNHNGFFTGARVWQGAHPADGLTASLQVTGTESDFNGDGRVDGADFLVWQRGVGHTLGATRADGDANADGMVDGADLHIWRGQFGATSAMAVAAATPEPGSLAMALFAAMALRPRRRRQHVAALCYA
ncbi:MAG TPA: hypothetical protein PKC18_04345 [Lacipirellulaceae bacterium]|nr:hypothetical protein [Lacipirellulaceae bacterium]